jgi:hypothetical protein
MKIAQIHIIFQPIPRRGGASIPTLHLAYIQGFECSKNPEPDINMYTTKREGWQDMRWGDIIEVSSVIRLIQLIPKFSHINIDGSVNEHNATEIWNEFYINPFFTKDMYRLIQ